MARSGNPKTENKLSVFFFSMRFHSAYMFLVQYMHTCQYNSKVFASVSFSVQRLKFLETTNILT